MTGKAMTRGSILHVCDFSNRMGGNFIPSLFESARRTRSEMDINTQFAFPEETRGSAWIDDMTRESMSVWFIDRFASRRYRSQWLGKLVAEHNISLLHSHFTHFDIDCALAGRKNNAHVIWHLHSGVDQYRLMHRARDLVKVRLVGRECKRVIACAPWIATQALERGFAAHKLRVVQNAIVLDRFADGRVPDRATARAQFELEPDIPTILAFCWDPHRKGTDLLLEAGRELAELGHKVLIALVGDVALESYVDRALHGEAHPDWLRLMRPVDDSPSLLSAVDIFVNASRFEGMAYAIAEAMASGCHVVMSDIPGSDLYRSAPDVTSFESANGRALAVALANTLERPDLPARSHANRAFAFQHFGIDGFTKELVDVYRELLEPRVPS